MKALCVCVFQRKPPYLHLATSYLHLATSEMWCWSGGRGILKKNLSLCYSIVYYYNGAKRCEQFLQVGRLYWALILLGLALSSDQAPLCFWSSWCYILEFFCLHPSLYLLVSWAWWDWPLTWLTNRHPSVLWHCWLGHLTRKIVSEMTYHVSSGMWNPTIPYRILFQRKCKNGRAYRCGRSYL